MKPIVQRDDILMSEQRRSRRRRGTNIKHQRIDMNHSYWLRRRFSTGTTALHGARNCKPCYVGDNVYDSIGQAARSENMNAEKLRVRLKRGQTTYQGKRIGFVELPPEVADKYYGHQTYEWDGNTFDTMVGFAKAVAADTGCSPKTVESHMYKHGDIDRLGTRLHSTYARDKRKTYHRATEKMATAPRKVRKAKFKPKKPAAPPTVPCSQIFFLGPDEFDAGKQVSPALAQIVARGGGVWKGSVVRVPQTENALALYRELLTNGERGP